MRGWAVCAGQDSTLEEWPTRGYSAQAIILRCDGKPTHTYPGDSYGRCSCPGDTYPEDTYPRHSRPGHSYAGDSFP